MAEPKKEILNSVFKLLLITVFVIFPFGQLGRVELQSGLVIHFLDFIVSTAVVVYLLDKLFKRNFVFGKSFRSFIICIGILSTSLLLNFKSVDFSEFIVGFLYLIRLTTYILFGFILWDAKVKKIITDAFILKGLLGMSLLIAVTSIFQYLFFPDLRFLKEYFWDDHLYRLTGAFLDPGFTGILILLSFLFVYSIFINKTSTVKNLIYILIPTLLSSLFLTYSRASFLAFVCSIGALLIWKKKFKDLLLTISIFFLGVFLLPRPGGEGVTLERTSTVYSRFTNYEEAIKVFTKSPIYGVGYNLYRYQRIDQGENLVHSGSGADSSLLFILATGGIVGALAFLYILRQVYEFTKQRLQTPYGSLLGASTIAILIHSQFTNSLFYPWVIVWMAFIFALQKVTVGKKQ